MCMFILFLFFKFLHLKSDIKVRIWSAFAVCLLVIMYTLTLQVDSRETP